MKRGYLVYLISLAVSCTSPAVYGQQLSAYPIPPEGTLWKGIATRYDARMLGPTYAHDAVNVWFDDDLGVVKRHGFVTYGTIGNSQAVRGLNRWVDTNGSEYLFALSGATITYTTNGTAFTISTSNWSSADTSIASAMNKLWFTSASDGLAYWDGSVLTKSTNAATGRYVAGWRNRLWHSGIAGARSRLDGSYYLDGNHWTLGDLATDPTQIVIGNNDGLPINCLFGGHSNYLFIGKERGIYALGGTDREDFNVVNISPEIGCLGNKTVSSTGQDTFWLSQRGIERMRNFTIETVSDPVKDIVDGIVLNSARTRYWTQTSKADWTAGDIYGTGHGSPMSVEQYSGAVSASTWTATHTSSADFAGGTFFQTTVYYDLAEMSLSPSSITYRLETWTDGDYTLNPVWSARSNYWAIHDDTTFGGKIACVVADGIYATENYGMVLDVASATWQSAGKWGLVARTIHGTLGASGQIIRYKFIHDAVTGDGYAAYLLYNSFGLEKVHDGTTTLLSSASISNLDNDTSTHTFTIIRDTAGVITAQYYWAVGATTTTIQATDNDIWIEHPTILIAEQGSTIHCIGISNITIPGYAAAGVYFSPVFDTGFSTSIPGGLIVSSDVPTGTTLSFQVRGSSDSAKWGAWQTVVNAATQTVTDRYWQWLSSFTTTIGTVTPSIQDVTLSAATSGYFISQCHALGTQITAWDVFNANDQHEGTGTVSYAMSTGPYCNEVTVATANWHTISAGTVPTLDTGAYVAIRALLTPQWPNAPVRVHDLEVNWIEGSSAQLPTGCVDLDGRYWLMYTTSSASNATIDSSLVFQRNGEWTRHFGIAALSCAQFNKRWYTGDAGATGKVHQQDTGYSDAGNAIYAMLETPDYSLSCPEKASGWICYKNLRKMNLDLYNPGESSVFNTAFMINGNGTWYDLGAVTLTEDTRYIHAELPWSQEQAQEGKFLRLKFWNNTSGQDLRYHRGVLIYEALPPDL